MIEPTKISPQTTLKCILNAFVDCATATFPLVFADEIIRASMTLPIIPIVREPNTRYRIPFIPIENSINVIYPSQP